MHQASNEHPLALTLAHVSQANEHFNARHGAPQSDGWRHPYDEYLPGSSALAARIAGTRAELQGASLGVVASSLLQGYQWPLISIAVAAYVLDRRVPDARPEDVWLHPKLNPEYEDEIDMVALAANRFWALPDDPDAGHPDAVVVPDRAVLRDALAGMVAAYIAPVVAALAAELSVRERGLWTDVADGLDGTVVWLLHKHDKTLSREQIDAELAALVRVPGTTLFNTRVGVFELSYRDQTVIHHHRASCCYWYKNADADGEYCPTCPRRPAAERDALLLKNMAEEYAATAGAVGNGDAV